MEFFTLILGVGVTAGSDTVASTYLTDKLKQHPFGTVIIAVLVSDTGNADFYRYVDADTVLIPISTAGDRTMRSDMYGDAPKINRAAEDRATVVHKAFEGTVTLEM